MFQMKYTTFDRTRPLTHSSQLNNTGRNVPLPAFNVKGNGDINSRALTIGNMFERIRYSNYNCNNCGSFKHGV